MRESLKYSPFLKTLSVILSILFLWGTGISMLIVFLNLRLGFAISEQEFNQYFLNLIEEDKIEDILQYARTSIEYDEAMNSKQSESAKQTESTEQLISISIEQLNSALRDYKTKYNFEHTNFRFIVRRSNNQIVVTNEVETNTQYLAQNIRTESIPSQEQNYKHSKHFSDMLELYNAITNNSMPQYLDNPSDFDIWYFEDTTIHEAYRNGVSVYESDGGIVAVRSFESLESAENFDYAAEFGDKAVARITGAEDTPDYNETIWKRVTEELGAKAVGTAKYWALIENTDGEPVQIRFLDYLRRSLNGESLRLENTELEKKLQAGVDIIITGHSGTDLELQIQTYLPNPLTVADSIRSDYGIFHLVYQYSEGIVMTMFGFLILTVIACIAMCSMAGHTPGTENIIISPVHKLPYEYFWILPPALIFLTMVVLSDIYSQVKIPYRIQAIFAAGMILMVAASAVIFLYTTAVRFKSETFWNSFGVVRMMNFIARIFKNRTLTCIALIIYILLLIGLNIFTVIRRSWLIFVTPVIDVISIGGLIYCVYAYFELYRHVRQMESGDFSPIERSLPLIADFNKFDTALGDITNHVGEMVARQTKAEHLRTELITNVSHDLKTPLTSIVNYVDLLSREPMQSEAAAEYLDVLKRQAARLKKLTIDLVDASKASTGNLTVELLPMNLQVLVGQIAGEYEEQLADKELSLVVNVPEEPVSVLADGRQIWRVFDNLLSNACKYAMTGTRVYLDVRAGEANVTITLKNVSATPLNTSPDELMERFVRGDASRHTEGSGLGLSIARDLTKLQQGTLTLQTDGDLFKAVLVFPIYHPPEESEQTTEES